MSPRRSVRTLGRVVVDALAYALVVVAVVFVGSLVLTVLTGGTLVRVKVLLFLAGWILLGYATFRLWPRVSADSSTEPRPAGKESIPGSPEATRFRTLVQRIPPMRWIEPPPPGKRLSPRWKLFLGSLLVLLTSFLMETVFGIT